MNPLTQFFRQYDAQLWILFSGWIVSAMGFAMVAPFLSIYFHLELRVPMTTVGGFFFYTAAIRAFAQGVAGDLSDRWGRRRIMIFAQIMRGVVFFAVAVSIQNHWGFYPTAVILACGFMLASSFQPAANAMVSDIVPATKRTEAFGLMRVASNVGWGVGPALGGFLASGSYAHLFWVGGALAILSAFTIVVFIRESNPQVSGPAVAKSGNHVKNPSIFSTTAFTVFHDRRFLLYCLSCLLMFLTMAQLISTLSVYAKESVGISHIELGWVYATNGLVIVLFQMLVARLVRNRNLLTVLMIGSFMYGVGYSLMSVPTALWGILVLIVFVTVAEMLVGPASTSLVASMAPPENQGLYMGAFGLFTTLGWSVGPFLGGIFLDHAPNPVLLWLGVSFFGLLGGVGFLLMKWRYPELKG
jgi:MFS family permease